MSVSAGSRVAVAEGVVAVELDDPVVALADGVGDRGVEERLDARLPDADRGGEAFELEDAGVDAPVVEPGEPVGDYGAVGTGAGQSE